MALNGDDLATALWNAIRAEETAIGVTPTAVPVTSPWGGILWRTIGHAVVDYLKANAVVTSTVSGGTATGTIS